MKTVCFKKMAFNTFRKWKQNIQKQTKKAYSRVVKDF